MDAFPTIPNRPGLFLEIVTWTGRVRGKVRKVYICESRRIVVDPKFYSPKVKEELEKPINWIITQSFPQPEPEGRKSRWRLVRQTGLGISVSEGDNAWPFIQRVICQDFSTPSRLQIQVRYMDPLTRIPFGPPL